MVLWARCSATSEAKNAESEAQCVNEKVLKALMRLWRAMSSYGVMKG